KLNGYIDCLGRFEDIRNAWGTYLSWREDGLQPPHCSERHVQRGMPAVYPDLAPECEALITAADSMPPTHPDLRDAGKTYVKLLHKILPLMKQMTGYYAKKRFRDDDCLKGRIFHAQWLKLYEKLIVQEKKLRQMVAELAKGALQACVERTRNRPQKATLHAWALLIQHVQETLRQFRIQAQSDTPELAAVARAISDMELEMGTFNQVPEQMMDTHDAELFDELLMAAKAFHEQHAGHTPGKKLLGTRVKNGVPVQVHTGSLEHVLDAFHNLLRRYNFHAKNNCVMMTTCNDDNTCPDR
ncbi:MAG: DUF3829 domain-containing protein, partial [Deltaproteobacteria bacterium]|nr:DUF3829 domain-containing protein [Deltaproteobacteria bacterium]